MDAIATRHERVIVELDDRFTHPMAKAAASTSRFRKNVDEAGDSTVVFDRTVRDTSPSIDKLSGRLSILARTAAALGPGFVPITTAAVPAVAGLATQLGFAAAAGGTAVLAFNGVGDALEAFREYQAEPTAENLEKLNETMKGLGPAAQEFVRFLDEIIPQLQTLREAAQEGLLPGMQEGIDSLLERLPQVRRIISEIATATGDLFAGAGAELASSEWDRFFNFLETDARPTLIAIGQTVGNLAKGIAELIVAMTPLSGDFTQGLLRASEAFERWAEGVSKTAGFKEFLAYVRETGPQVLDTIGSLANMLLQVAEAAAPMGGPVLSALEAVANVVAAIADSSVGPPLLAFASAMSAVSLAMRGWEAAKASAIVQSLTGIGDVSPKAAAGLDRLRAAAAGILVLEGAGLVIEQLQGYIEDSLPGVQQLTSDLLALNSASKGKEISANFEQVGAALNRIADPNKHDLIQGVGDALYSLGEKGGTLGKALAGGVAGMVGLTDSFADATFTLNASRETISRLDQAFAELVGLVGAEQARAAFRAFAEDQGLSSEKTKELLKLMPGYREALASAANAARAHGRGTDASTEALNAETHAIAENLEAMRNRRSEALRGENAEIDYQQAIDDARRSLKENGNTMDITTEKGRNNRRAMLDLAAAWNNQSDAAKNLPGAYKGAIQTFVDTFGHLFKNEKQARQYARELYEIPPKRHTAVELDKAGAERSLREYKAYLGNIPRHIQTTLTVKRVRGGPIIPGVSNADGNVMEFYASGGIRPNIGDQQPQIQPNQGPRGITWAETGAGPWEAFISGHPAKRERSRNIADEVVSRLGGAVAWKAADGLMLARQAAAAAPATPNVTVQPDSAAVAEIRALRGQVAALSDVVNKLPDEHEKKRRKRGK